MTYSTTVHPQELIIVTPFNSLVLGTEAQTGASQQQAERILLERGNATVVFILDTRGTQVNAVEMLTHLRKLARRTRTQSLPASARLKMLLVGDETTGQVIARFLRSPEYGGWDAPVYPTVDDALVVARQLLWDGTDPSA